MSTKTRIRKYLKELEEFDDSAAGFEMDLRLSLSQIVLRQLKARGWTQRQLALEADFKEPFISRILHANANCTLETAGRILYALGVRAVFQETDNAYVLSGPVLKLSGQETTHGEETYKGKEETNLQVCEA